MTLRTWPAVLVTLGALGCKPALPEQVRARLVEAMPDAVVTVRDDANLTLKKGDLTVDLGLDNLRAACQRDPDSCAAQIDGLVANAKFNLGQAQSLRGEQVKLDPATLRLTLKNRSWLSGTDTMITAKGPAKYEDNRLLSEPLAADVAMVFVLDQPNGMRMLQGADLKKLKLDASQVRELALKNLQEVFPEVKMSEEVSGLFSNDEGGDYDAALLALPQVWKPLATRLGGKLVVGVPARNRVFAAAPGKIDQLEAATRKAFETMDHPISAAVFDWSESGFKEHRP